MRRINPDIANIIMIVTTLLAPSGVYFWSVQGIREEVRYIKVSIHAIVWGIMPEGASGAGFTILDSYVTIRGVFFGIFNILFCVEVIRFSRDYTRRKAALVSCAFSFLQPILWAIIALSFFFEYATFAYVGPIPIQQVIGLAIMKLSGAPEPKSPWSEQQTSNLNDYDIGHEELS